MGSSIQERDVVGEMGTRLLYKRQGVVFNNDSFGFFLDAQEDNGNEKLGCAMEELG